MRGCAARAAGDLRRPLVGQLDPQQVGAAGQHQLELGRLVELHLPDEPEPVAQRPGQQAGARGGADQGERVDLQRDGGGPGPLADDDVDPEVLHRHVQQFLGRPGDAVDLVDEQHVAGREVGQHRGEVAGALDGRAAGDLHRGAQLGADDQREAGLAEPGRAGQQHVVRRPAAALGALEHQRELAGHLGLADEVVQRVRSQGGLDDPLLVTGLRRDGPLLAEIAARPRRSATGRTGRSCPTQQLQGLPQQDGDLDRAGRHDLRVGDGRELGQRRLGLLARPAQARSAPRSAGRATERRG